MFRTFIFFFLIFLIIEDNSEILSSLCYICGFFLICFNWPFEDNWYFNFHPIIFYISNSIFSTIQLSPFMNKKNETNKSYSLYKNIDIIKNLKRTFFDKWKYVFPHFEFLGQLKWVVNPKIILVWSRKTLQGINQFMPYLFTTDPHNLSQQTPTTHPPSSTATTIVIDHHLAVCDHWSLKHRD